MKIIKILTVGILSAAFLASPFAGSVLADDKKADPKAPAKLKPYTLKTCIVTDEELGGMGKPFVLEHEGREIKLCCKSCQKDFKKDPAKYLKKIKDAGSKEEISAKLEALNTASHKLAEAMYAKTAQQQGAGAGPQPGADAGTGAGAQAGGKKDDDVVDADFEDVKK